MENETVDQKSKWALAQYPNIMGFIQVAKSKGVTELKMKFNFREAPKVSSIEIKSVSEDFQKSIEVPLPDVDFSYMFNGVFD